MTELFNAVGKENFEELAVNKENKRLNTNDLKAIVEPDDLQWLL